MSTESDGFTYPVVLARLIQLLLENHAPISLPTCVHVLAAGQPTQVQLLPNNIIYGHSVTMMSFIYKL